MRSDRPQPLMSTSRAVVFRISIQSVKVVSSTVGIESLEAMTSVRMMPAVFRRRMS